jgi:hypothetical protein
MRLRAWLVPAAAVAAQLAMAPGVSACAVCVGDPNSPLTWGLSRGVLFLIAMIGVVYVAVAAFIVAAWRRRARRLRHATAALQLDVATTGTGIAKVAHG